MRFMMTSRMPYWNAGRGNAYNNYRESKTSPHNIVYDKVLGKEDDVVCFSITLNSKDLYLSNDKENEFCRQRLYVDGKKTSYDGGFNKLNWDIFVNDNLPDLSYFCIGRSSFAKEGAWLYGKMNAYSIKLYNRALTEEEILESYNKDVAYHQFLVNGGTIGTTEGSDVVNY